MNKNILLYCLLCISVLSQAQSTITLETRYSSGTGSWVSRQAKLVNLIANFSTITNAALLDVNNYGSSNKTSATATGFFYTKKINNRWWIIDPEGKAGFNIAVNAIPTISDNTDLGKVYDRLWELGFNGAGSFMSDEGQSIRYNNTHTNQFSYTRRVNFYNTYVGSRKSYYPTTSTRLTGSMLDYIFVFDPKFAEFCDARAKTFGDAYKTEKNLLGYFLDNEIGFHTDQLQKLLRDLDPGDPSYEMAKTFVISKGLTVTQVVNNYSSVSTAIRNEFATKLADKYYEITTKAMKKYDPNHITLGSRLHGGARDLEGVVKAAATWCDVVSVNFYDLYSPNEQITSSTKYKAWIDKPIIIGEFYTKGYDAYEQGIVTGFSGAGWVVKTQTHRGYFYQNTCIEFIQSGTVVGWHYFKYSDDTDSNKGMYKQTSMGGDEYTEMTNQMRLVNINRFNLVDFFTAIGQTKIQNISFHISENNLILDGEIEPAEISIFDLNAKLLLSGLLDNMFKTINISTLNKGVYILKLQTKDGKKFYTTKFIL